ncbi:MAG: hypothetical protein IKU83_06320 [Lachnospiraceae bacterium]|nr:hypothetical protein [Lachnospiraceae bacterium]
MAYIIDSVKDAAFLKESELDMSTYKRFEAGDRVIVCAECNKVHLESSWNEAGSVCPNCGKSRTKRVKTLNDMLQVTVLSKRGGSVRVSGRTPATSTPTPPPIRTGRFRSIPQQEVPVTGTGSVIAGTGERRRRFRPLGMIIAGLILFLAFSPIKNFVKEAFFTEAEAAQEQQIEEAYQYPQVEVITGNNDRVVCDPVGCVVTAPMCNLRTAPEVAEGNIITQLSKGTPVDWSDATTSEEGTDWFYVTTLDEAAVSGWVSGKTIEYIYDAEIMVVPHAITAPLGWHNAEHEYTAAEMLDGYCLTAWYSEDSGVGTEITFEYEEAVVRNVVITNGDAKSEADYLASNRMCEVEVIFDNGESYHTTIADEYLYGGQMHLIDTDKPSTSMTLRVNSVYEGDNPHLAISDITLYTMEIDRSADYDGWRQ